MMSNSGTTFLLEDESVSRHSSLHVTFVDVGQGDSTLIHLPGTINSGQSAILIDCPAGRSRTILDMLQKHHINRIELIIVTHSDDDHCGGLIDIIGDFSHKGS